MSSINDISVAFGARWDSHPTLSTRVPGGITRDEAGQGQITPTGTDPRQLPYAIMRIELTEKRYRHVSWTDSHRVTVSIYHENDAGDYGQLVTDIHEWFVWKSKAVPNKLTYTATNTYRKHAHTKISDDQEDIEQEKRRGEHIRVARLVFQ